MKRFFLVCLLLTLVVMTPVPGPTGSASGESIFAEMLYKIENTRTRSDNGSGAQTKIKFLTPSSPAMVSHLGYIDLRNNIGNYQNAGPPEENPSANWGDGLKGDYTITLKDMTTGTVVATGLVGPETPLYSLGFRWVELTEPIILDPAHTYDLWADRTAGLADPGDDHDHHDHLKGQPIPNWNDYYGLHTNQAETHLHVNLAYIPEPGTLALLAMGLLGLGFYAWRRSRR